MAVTDVTIKNQYQVADYRLDGVEGSNNDANQYWTITGGGTTPTPAEPEPETPSNPTTPVVVGDKTILTGDGFDSFGDKSSWDLSNWDKFNKFPQIDVETDINTDIDEDFDFGGVLPNSGTGEKPPSKTPTPTRNPFSLANIVQFFEEMKTAAGSIEALFDQIDADDDNVILRTEFAAFLKSNTPAGEVYSLDLLNDFWDVLDINQSHKKIANTNFKNLNAVTLEEMQKMDVAVKEQETVKAYIQNMQVPSNLLDAGTQGAWLYEMSNAINKAFLNATNKGETIDLDSLYKQLFLEITPKHVVADMQILNSALLSQYDYRLSQDLDGVLGENIKSNLEIFIKQNPNASDEEIVDIIQEVIAKFIETADLTAKLPDVAGKLNSAFELDPIFAAKFSELQKAVMSDGLSKDTEANEILSHFSKELQYRLKEGFYNDYYIAMSGSNFATLNANAPKAFVEYITNAIGDVTPDIEEPEDVEETEEPEEPKETKDVYGYDERSLLTSWYVASGEQLTIDGDVPVTKNGVSYTDYSIEPLSMINIDTFDQTGTMFTLKTKSITSESIIVLRFIDNANDELMFSKTLTIIPESLEIIDDDLVVDPGDGADSDDPVVNPTPLLPDDPFLPALDDTNRDLNTGSDFIKTVDSWDVTL